MSWRNIAAWSSLTTSYEKIVYDNFQVHNIVALNPALRDRTVIINGVSKTYAMTGWRIGYAIGPADIISAAGKIQSQSTSNPTSIAQAAALEAISGSQVEVPRMVREFKQRRDVIVDRLNAIQGMHCLKPQGAFYVFPNISALLGRTANGKNLLPLATLPITSSKKPKWLSSRARILVPWKISDSPTPQASKT